MLGKSYHRGWRLEVGEEKGRRRGLIAVPFAYNPVVTVVLLQKAG